MRQVLPADAHRCDAHGEPPQPRDFDQEHLAESFVIHLRRLRSTSGRLLRVVAGFALIVVGLSAVKGILGVVIAILGLVPLAAGAFNFCVLGPLFRVDLWGRPKSVA